MNLSWVQRASAVPPWWGDDSCALIEQSGWYHIMIPTTFALFERIEIGGVAPIGAIPGQLGKVAMLLQIG